MATPVYSKDPVTGQAIWTLPGEGGSANPPTTGAGGSPQSGSSWVPPGGVTLPGSTYVNSTVNGFPQGYTSQQPDLASFLRMQEASFQNNPRSVEQGTAPADIASILQSTGQNYLLMNPDTGNADQLAQLVSQLGGQYSDWYKQYQQYLVNQGSNISGLAPSVAAMVQQAQPIAAPSTPGGFIYPNGTPSQGAPAATPMTAATMNPPQTPAQILAGSPKLTSPLVPTNAVVDNGAQTAPPRPTTHVSDLNQLVYSPNAAPGSPASTPQVTTPTPTAPASMLTSGATPSSPTTGADLSSYLLNIVKNGGNPISALPAWQAMQDAQQQTINRGIQQLKEQFGASGNRFSTGFGTALGDYMNQAALNQNSLLGQMTYQSLSDAANRQLSGASTLSGEQLQSALAMLQAGYGAAGQIAGAQNTAGLTAAQQYTQLLQMGLSSAQALAVLQQQNLTTGANLGGQQQTLQQQAIDRQVSQYFQSLPQFNPLMPYFQQGANTYPQLFGQQFPISQLGAILGGIGGLLGIAPSLIQGLTQIFKGSGNNGSTGTINSQGGLGNNPLALPPTLPPLDLPGPTISIGQLFGLPGY